MTVRAHIASQKSKIASKIDDLQKELSYWVQLERLYEELPLIDVDHLKKSPKSAGQNLTYLLTVDLIQKSRGPVGTALILKYLRDGVRDDRPEETIRSHLKRLKDAGRLIQNQPRGPWSLPP